MIGRFVFDAASRWIAEVTRAARTTGDAGLGRRLADVQLTCAEMRTRNWPLEVAERLVLQLAAEVPAGGYAQR